MATLNFTTRTRQANGVLSSESRKEVRADFVAAGKKFSMAVHPDASGKANLVGSVGGQRVVLEVSTEVIEWVRGQRAEIAAELAAAELVKNEKEYAPLIADLPAFVAPQDGQMDAAEKARIQAEIAKQTELLKFYRSEEDEGIRLSLTSTITRLETQLHDGCAHDFQVSYEYGQDAFHQKQVTRRHTCPKCGMVITAKSDAGIPESALWN